MFAYCITMQVPTGSAAFKCKSAVSITSDAVHASDLGFGINEGAACTLYGGVKLIDIVGLE
jgi:hypothetical protein